MVSELDTLFHFFPLTVQLCMLREGRFRDTLVKNINMRSFSVFSKQKSHINLARSQENITIKMIANGNQSTLSLANSQSYTKLYPRWQHGELCTAHDSATSVNDAGGKHN